MKPIIKESVEEIRAKETKRICFSTTLKGTSKNSNSIQTNHHNQLIFEYIILYEP